MVSLVIDAVPPPFWPPLVENKKLKFGGEASERTTGASVPSHVSVRRMLSRLLSKITSFMISDLFKRERALSTGFLMSVLNIRTSCLFKGMLKTQCGLKTVLGLMCLCEILVLIVWMLSCASGDWKGSVYSVGRGG